MRRQNFVCRCSSVLTVGAMAVVALLGTTDCGSRTNGNGSGSADAGSGITPPDACVGLQCQITACAAMNMPETTITGTVWAPNGTLPLDEVNVYVPNTQTVLAPFPTGVQCETCATPLDGDPIVTATSGLTGSAGTFTLSNVPNGSNIPVVITIGKWRRQLLIPNVAACTATPLSTPDTSLPKSGSDMTADTTGVDLPQIAVSTGEADALECLILKLGIAKSEISTVGQAGHIHLFADTKAGGNEGAASFANGWGGGTGDFADSQTLWGGSTGSGILSNYDIAIFSCEGAQVSSTKSQNAMNNVQAYADNGGRLFMSHWHNIWIEGNTQDEKNDPNGTPTEAPAEWVGLASFNDANQQNTGGALPNGTIDDIDTNADDNPKGTLFANWMADPSVGGSGPNTQPEPTTLGQVTLGDGTGKQTAVSVNGSAGTERWVNLEPTGNDFPQIFQFNTQASAPATSQCGKVVFSDMHVSGDSTSPSGGTYPTGCSNAGLTPQEKALAFMFFDISTCAGTIE